MAKKASVHVAPAVPEETAAGKGRATPTRREREAARRQPLVPTDRKGAQRTSRTAQAAARERARVGMAAGEERYLPARDRGPQRRFARDVVDSSWTIGEFLIPVFVLFFIVTLVAPAQSWLLLPLYGYLALTILDGLVRARSIRKRLAAKLGDPGRVERGLTVYVLMRAAQLRTLRMPKPQVRRGAKVV